jgi:hypothetical protein
MHFYLARKDFKYIGKNIPDFECTSPDLCILVLGCSDARLFALRQNQDIANMPPRK